MDLTVPPTLVSFAVGTAHVDNIVSQDLKGVDHRLVFFDVPRMYDDTQIGIVSKKIAIPCKNKLKRVVFTLLM